MRVQIFDVEHGFCALVTGRDGERILVDCGHNSTTGWRPSKYLSRKRLDVLIISNYDQDHLSDFQGIQQNIGFNWLCRNFSLSPMGLYNIKKEECTPSPAMQAFVSSISQTGPVTTLPPFSSVRVATFSIPFPLCETETNEYSLVTFIEGDGVNIVFPGDLTEQGWKTHLLNPTFREYLSRVNLFVASHHGRWDGYCSEVFRCCRPDVVIVSDDSIQHDTQRGVNYGQHANGRLVAGEIRKTLTTRCHGNITIQAGTGLIGSYMTIETEKGIPEQQSPIALALSAFETGRTTPSPTPLPNASLLASFLSSPQPPKASSLLTSYTAPRTTILGGMIEQALRDEKKRRGGGNV